MNPIIASLSELTKMFAELFRVAFLFPAMVFTLLNGIVILPHFDSLSLVQEFYGYDRADKILIGSLFALLLGYIMNAVEDPIVQLFKGRIWKETWFGTLLTYLQEKRKQRMIVWIEQHDAKNIIPYHFPSSKNSEMLPTTLGNIITAYEDYPGQTYKMNAADFWPRMYPVLVKNSFFPYIAGQRSPVDFLNFLLNSSLVLGVFGFECLAVHVFLYELPWFIPSVTFVFSCLFYHAAINRAYKWGETYRAVFDLYRHQLAAELRLKPVYSFQEEREMWENVSELWSYQPKDTFDKLNYKADALPVTN